MQRTVDRVEREGVALTFHQVHRPLQAWFALVREAGYLVEDLREPRPTAAAAAGEPALEKSRARPAFLHLRCVKPAE